MHKSITYALAVTCGAGLGLIIDRQLPRATADAPVAAFCSPGAPMTTAAGSFASQALPDLERLRAAIREDVRAELATALAPGSNTGTRSVGAAGDSAASAASAQQVQEATQTANAILSSGVWTVAQNSALQNQLADLDPDQREAIMQRLVEAMHNGSLRRPGRGSSR